MCLFTMTSTAQASVEFPQQQLCSHCSSINNLALIGPCSDHWTLKEQWLGQTSHDAWYGPTLAQLEQSSLDCALCREVRQLLEHFQLLGGDQDRRTALRLVNELGFISDGQTSWDERTEERRLDRVTKLADSAGIAAVGVFVEETPRSAVFPSVASIGLRVFLPKR